MIGRSNRWTSTPPQFADEPLIDRSTVIGLLVASGLVLAAIASSGDPLKFLRPLSLLLVVGGTFAITLIHFSIDDILFAFRSARSALFQATENVDERIRMLVRLAHDVKRDGILVLEQVAAGADDPFFRLGLDMASDGQSPDEIKRILENEMRSSHERAWQAVQVFETMGNFAPALGLIGTLVGLVQMLGSLSDPSVVGPAMSLALVATLYGAVAANIIFFPLAGKLRLLATQKSVHKNITIEGVMSLARLESPIIMEQRLQSFSALANNG